MTTTIGALTPGRLGEILAAHDRFWGGRDLRPLHHPMFFHQFADTGLVAADTHGDAVGYLLGFVTPAGEGYTHLVAVRDDARRAGTGRALYERFAATAAGRGATALTAITSPGNAASVAFHERLGYTARRVPDYAGPGADRVLFRRELGPAPIGPARPGDAGELLTLQRAAYLPEVIRYREPIPPAVESLDAVRAAIGAGGVLVARDAGRVVGAVRAVRDGDTGHIGRLMVAPDRQGQGLGTRLLRAAEDLLPGVSRYVLFTGTRSAENLRLYTRLGYVETWRDVDAVGVAVVYLERTLG